MLPLKEYPFDRRPMICAHRGDTSHGAIENTLDAIRAALESGADMIEVDVQMTADGVFVCYHDETIGPDDEKLTIWKEKYADLLSKLAGRTPARFEEVLALAKGKAYLNIEMKEYSSRPGQEFIVPLVEMVRRAGMQEYVLYSSFRLDYLRLMPWDAITTVIQPTTDIVNYFNKRSATPVILTKKVEDLLPSEIMNEAKATTYACRLDELDERHVQNIRNRNIHLSIYTIKDEAEYDQALKFGARAVVTDIPHVLVEVRGKVMGNA